MCIGDMYIKENKFEVKQFTWKWPVTQSLLDTVLDYWICGCMNPSAYTYSYKIMLENCAHIHVKQERKQYLFALMTILWKIKNSYAVSV